MKGMKGKFLRKLKTIQAIGTLKQGLVFQVNLPKTTPNLDDENPPNDTNISLPKPSKNPNHHEEYSDSDLKTTPNLDDDQNDTSLSDFDEKCPPGGQDKVILYTTSLRGIRKTFEDCSAVRFLLESYKVSFFERDVSLHREFREEMWTVLEEKVLPPRLFVKGRYIGGVEEVVEVLNEQGKLRKLFDGIPRNPNSNEACVGCDNVRFVVCFNCHGSKKVVAKEIDELCHVRCPDCNENGLVKCHVCS